MVDVAITRSWPALKYSHGLSTQGAVSLTATSFADSIHDFLIHKLAGVAVYTLYQAL